MHLGNNRIVFLVGPFAIKVAKTYIFDEIWRNWFNFAGLNDCRSPIRKISFWDRCIRDIFYAIRKRWPLAIKHNWLEFVYSARYKRKNMMPTYFSIGLVNIQKRGYQADFDFQAAKAMYLDLYRIHPFDPDCKSFNLGSAQLAHHWEQNNFCYDTKGNLRMIDYGDPEILWFLLEHPDFFEPFHKSSK
ncbi:MAG: hypothetical protein WC663_01240 [Patescibacteria group bacterium]|jgi:hypothetical protein